MALDLEDLFIAPSKPERRELQRGDLVAMSPEQFTKFLVEEETSRQELNASVRLHKLLALLPPAKPTKKGKS